MGTNRLSGACYFSWINLQQTELLEMVSTLESAGGLADLREAASLSTYGIPWIKACRRLVVAWRDAAGPLGPRSPRDTPAVGPTPPTPFAPPCCRCVRAPRRHVART